VPSIGASCPPVHLRRLVGLVLVAANERQYVAGFRIRHGDPRVGRPADGGRDPGDHFERETLFVQEQRFLAAAVEHEWVAPLEAHDRLPLARLLGEQQTDGLLLQRLGSRRADVDPLRTGPGLAKQPHVDAMVVDDDVRGLEVPLAPHADERGIARARADDVDTRLFHKTVVADSLIADCGLIARLEIPGLTSIR